LAPDEAEGVVFFGGGASRRRVSSRVFRAPRPCRAGVAVFVFVFVSGSAPAGPGGGRGAVSGCGGVSGGGVRPCRGPVAVVLPESRSRETRLRGPAREKPAEARFLSSGAPTRPFLARALPENNAKCNPDPTLFFFGAKKRMAGFRGVPGRMREMLKMQVCHQLQMPPGPNAFPCRGRRVWPRMRRRGWCFRRRRFAPPGVPHSLPRTPGPAGPAAVLVFVSGSAPSWGRLWPAGHTWCTAGPVWCAAGPTWCTAGPVWCAAGPAWCTAGPVWCAAGPTWCAAGPVWCAAGPAWCTAGPAWCTAGPVGWTTLSLVHSSRYGRLGPCSVPIC